MYFLILIPNVCRILSEQLQKSIDETPKDANSRPKSHPQMLIRKLIYKYNFWLGSFFVSVCFWPFEIRSDYFVSIAPFTTKDLQPGRMKLLRCDDEMCEYEDIDDGQIKVKTITKKIVKLKWEEAPTNVLIIKKQADPLSKGHSLFFPSLFKMEQQKQTNNKDTICAAW